MPSVSFKTRRGRSVSFKVRPKSQQSKKRPLGSFAKFVKKMSKSHPRLKGPALFKTAAKKYSPRR